MATTVSYVVKTKCLMHVRGLALSAPNLKDQLTKRARIIEKLLTRGKKKKQFGVSTTNNPFGGPVGNARRAAVLSNLFLENITDVMSTEECGSQLQGYGIEITYVKVPADCKVVNVYWTIPSSNYDQVKTVSKLLKACAGEIRSEMTRQHVLGIVPYINFVQDKAAKNAAEVERLLSIADYGPDYIPTDSGKVLFQDSITDLKSFAEEKVNRAQNITALEEKKNDKESNVSSLDDNEHQRKNNDDVLNNLPPMKMNVFTLDYNSIMNQVIHKMKKPYKLELQREIGVSEFVKDHQWSMQNIDLCDTAEKRSININTFLKERNKLIQAKYKILEKMLPENEVEEKDSQELLENSKVYLEEDYYDESEFDGNRHYMPLSDESDNK